MFVTSKVAGDIQAIEGCEDDVHPGHCHFVVIYNVIDDLRHPCHWYPENHIGFTKVELSYVKEG